MNSKTFAMIYWRPLGMVATLIAGLATAAEPAEFKQPAIKVPEGYTVELAAGPPLVEHPLMAGFDERGRLYIAENAGNNMQRPALEENLPNYIARLEDTNGDGRFDKRTVFADKLTFPQGALWHDGWLYVASSGAIWRFRDKDDDGVADVREKIVSSFGYTGNAADVHGCFLGPEGRIYWCEGRHGHDIVDAAGQSISKGKAARIFSCRPDGSDVQVHCGGGMDNPVEIDWTDEGEMLGTVNIMYAKRGDCLVHWMHGGVYPRHDQPEVLKEFRRTGDLLDAVFDYGHVAVSGCCRVRAVGNALRGVPGAAESPPLPLGEGGRRPGEGRDATANPHPSPLPMGEGAGNTAATSPAATFLVTEFNTHKVKQTHLFRDGSTFRAHTIDFLYAASDDFHPTDVLEDADGSFLVIDTGGWFRIGCPTSQVAKPNILGAIYRVRRTDAPKIDDPRGLLIEWNKLDATALVALLGDARHAVRERAIQTLANQKDAAVPYLSRALLHKDATVRRNAVWSLTRIGTPKAQGSVRLLGLADRNPSVLAVAAYSGGATRDVAALDDLGELLANADTPPQVAREAATSLGKIGESDLALPTILAALGRDSDRVLEHALIYALIEIADRDATAKILASDSPRLRRAALIALDQMPEGNLTRDQLAPLLDTTDQPLLTAALDVLSRHPGWSDELIALAGKLLDKKELSEQEQSLLGGSLVAVSKDDRAQRLVSEHLPQPGEALTPRFGFLLDVMVRSDVRPWPAAWIASVKDLLATRSDVVLPVVISAAAACPDDAFVEPLSNLAKDTNRPKEIRLSALSALADQKRGLTAEQFKFVLIAIGSDAPLNRLAAARILEAAELTRDQRLELIKLGNTNYDVFHLLADVRLEGFLPSIKAEDAFKLDSLLQKLDQGSMLAGKQVFASRKAACATCHRVGTEGGKIGPDLSKVGERRNQRDLLEAVIFPSASLARGFETHAIRTVDGQTVTGQVVRETAESLFLRTLDQREVRLRRSEIDAQKPSTTSIMPAGLDKALTQQELADLLAYLGSLK